MGFHSHKQVESEKQGFILLFGKPSFCFRRFDTLFKITKPVPDRALRRYGAPQISWGGNPYYHQRLTQWFQGSFPSCGFALERSRKPQLQRQRGILSLLSDLHGWRLRFSHSIGIPLHGNLAISQDSITDPLLYIYDHRGTRQGRYTYYC